MNYDTNINLPLRLDVPLCFIVYSKLTAYVPLNSCLAGKNLRYFVVSKKYLAKAKINTLNLEMELTFLALPFSRLYVIKGHFYVSMKWSIARAFRHAVMYYFYVQLFISYVGLLFCHW